MPIYSQSDFGYASGTADSFYGRSGIYQTAFSEFSFSQPMRINRVAFKMGAEYGYSSSGGAYGKHGGFDGVYCIWDGDTLIATSARVSSDSYVAVGSPQINRPDIWASFGGFKVSANKTYRIGYAQCYNTWGDNYGCSAVYYHPAGNKASQNMTTKNYSYHNLWGYDPYIWLPRNVRTTGSLVFKIDAEPANTGVKLRANNKWNHRKGHFYNGSWSEKYLKVREGNSWVDVSTDQTAKHY